MTGIKLVSLPWRSTHNAPIDLGSLAAHVQREEPTYTVNVCLTYLEAAKQIGVNRYDAIALSAREEGVGDSFYSSMLYPEARQASRERFIIWAHTKPTIKSFVGHNTSALEKAFDDISEILNEHLDAVISSRSWESSVVGLTTTYNQLFSSIEFAKRLKALEPDAMIVLGGMLVSGPSGASIIGEFPWIDFVVQGEGERPFVDLLRQMESGDVAEVPSVLSQARNDRKVVFSQVTDINKLPTPNYDAYYASSVIQGHSRDRMAISIEASV